jgi:hypothetical protein
MICKEVNFNNTFFGDLALSSGILYEMDGWVNGNLCSGGQ